MNFRKYLGYFIELKSLYNKIFACSDLDEQNILIEDYNRMLIHLLSSDKYKNVNDKLEACNSNYYSNCSKIVREKFISDFYVNKDLLLDSNYKSLFCFFDAKYNYGFLSKIVDCSKSVIDECFRDFVNSNNDVFKSFNLVKDRITIDSSYNIPGLMGHSVCLSTSKPCISVKKGDYVRNKYIISHELGHIFDYYFAGNKRFLNNYDFIGECYSILFELYFVKLLKKYDYEVGRSLDYLSGDSYFNIAYNQTSMKVYNTIYHNVPVNDKGKFVPKVSDDTIKFLSKFDLSGVDLAAFQYIIGYSLATGFINSGYDLSIIINEYKKFVKNNDFVNVINNIDYNGMKEYIKKI